MLIGTFISLILHGVVLVQTFSYHENYKEYVRTDVRGLPS